jgi:phospholipid transport system substrate-binding protein
MNRRTFGHVAMVALVSVFAWTAATPAVANPDAEAFTQKVIDEGLHILRDGGAGARFHEFIFKYADASKAAMFTLGPYRKTAAKGDLDSFVDAYREFQFALYARSLDKYKNKSLKVTGSVDNQPGDTTVNTVVADESGRTDKGLRVSFRMAGTGGSYKFTDVQIEGAWISQSQLEQFRAILNRNGGNIPELTQEIQNRTQHMND